MRETLIKSENKSILVEMFDNSSLRIRFFFISSFIDKKIAIDSIPGIGFIPQSITTAPGLIQSPLTSFGLPMPTTRISARRTIDGRSLVFEWQTVTVA